MKAFLYNGELYLRCIPGKQLFRSTLVHEVVNRGDIFAMRCSDQQLTIVPGTANVAHCEAQLCDTVISSSEQSSADKAERARAKLRAISFELNSGANSIAEATQRAAGKQPTLFDGEVG